MKNKILLIILLLLSLSLFGQKTNYQEGQKIYSLYDLLYFDYISEPVQAYYMKYDYYYIFKFIWFEQFTQTEIEMDFKYQDREVIELIESKNFFIVLKCQFIKLENIIYVSPDIYYSGKKNNYKKVKNFDNITEDKKT